MNLGKMRKIVSQLAKIEKELKKLDKMGITLERIFNGEMCDFDEIGILVRVGHFGGFDDANSILGLPVEEKRSILVSLTGYDNEKERNTLIEADDITIIVIWGDLLKAIALIVAAIELVKDMFREAYHTTFQCADFFSTTKEDQETYSFLLMVHFMHNVSMSQGKYKCRLKRNMSSGVEDQLDKGLLQCAFGSKNALPDFLSNVKMYDYIYITAINILHRSEDQDKFMDDGVLVLRQVDGEEHCVLPLMNLPHWQTLYILLVQKFY